MKSSAGFHRQALAPCEGKVAAALRPEESLKKTEQRRSDVVQHPDRLLVCLYNHTQSALLTRPPTKP